MIIPALLTDKKEELIRMVNICREFTDYVQIDIMDGEFVPSRSVGILDFKGWKVPLRWEAHIMVSDPIKWIKPFKDIGAERIIYHFEVKKDHSKIISKIRAMNLGVGLAINPFTAIDEFTSLVERVDTVLFMSVNPGFYGAEFIPQVLEKIKSFKNKYPGKQTGIDGGVKLGNLALVKSSGVDYICVGSAILGDDNPKQAYLNLLNLLNG